MTSPISLSPINPGRTAPVNLPFFWKRFYRISRFYVSLMIGMVLCGGHGKRLRPLTDEVPKSLIEIKDGYTILDKQLLDMRYAGFERVVLLTGYLSEKIEERYGSRWRGLEVEYAVEEEPLGTLNAIRLGIERVDDDVLVRNGDVVADINIRKMVSRFRDSGYLASMFITRMRSPYGIVEVGDDRIKRFREKPLLDYYINGGVYCFRRDVVRFFREFETGDIEKTVFPLLVREGQFGFYQEDGGFWMSIDTTKDLEEIRKEYANRVDKPWGYEKILVRTEKYLSSEVFIYEGYQTSLHYHENKDETLYIMKGSGYVQFEGGKRQYERNDAIRIKPGVKHTIVAAENTLIQSVSTPHLGDSVRVEDYYGR